MSKQVSVSFNKAEKLLKLGLNAGLAVMLHGSPSSKLFL